MITLSRFAKRNAENNRWQTDFYQTQRAHGLQWKYVTAAKFIDEGAKVLDVGCGDGTFLKYLKDTKNCDCVGLDYSKEAVKLARAKGLEVFLFDVDAGCFPLAKNEFDYCTCIDVLEHILYPLHALEKIRDVSARAVIGYSNPCWYRYRLRFLLGTIPKGGPWREGVHLWFWNINDLNNLLKAAGWKPIKYEYLPGVPFVQRFSRCVAEKICRLMPSLFGYGIIVLCNRSGI